MISKRKLFKWRKEALKHQEIQNDYSSDGNSHDYGVLGSFTESISYINKVLELTQELIDQHLIKEKS